MAMLIRSSLRDAGGDGLPFLHAPWAQGLPLSRVDLLSLLPVTGINDWFDQPAGPAPPGAVHGLLAADPFIHIPDIARSLLRAGITGVANFPSTQLMDGETVRALDASGCGPQREFEVMGQLAALGLALTVVVSDMASLRTAARLPCLRIVIHPGLPLPEVAARSEAAARAAALIDAARQSCPDAAITLYHPPGFGHELTPAIAQADEVLCWAADHMPG
ncbi:MAG: phosphoenolpyruvate hydrolase family protein [Paracoccus sp. (in: a-proteobacteria)]|uniref:phosphoenolpyruvate hydrolase family protein n=1 Tax=Paracoccus sp. TaxID=267 RepID=UPI0039191932